SAFWMLTGNRPERAAAPPMNCLRSPVIPPMPASIRGAVQSRAYLRGQLFRQIGLVQPAHARTKLVASAYQLLGIAGGEQDRQIGAQFFCLRREFESVKSAGHHQVR